VIAPVLIAAMFKLNPNPTFTCTVRLSVPGSDASAPITFTFRHKGARDLRRWLSSAAQSADDVDFLDEVIESWSGVVSEDGSAVPYSKETLAVLLDAYPASAAELVLAYRSQLVDARAKN
jgi:hypothetical protein